MPRSRKLSTLSPLKRPFDENFDEEDVPEKKRKTSESSETSPDNDQKEAEIGSSTSPKTSASEAKTDASTEEDVDTGGDSSPNPSASGTDKRNRSLEALFVVTDNELQNIAARQPDTEEIDEDQVIVLNDLQGVEIEDAQIVITQTDEKGQQSTEKLKQKILLKAEAYDQLTPKLMYTKQASESSLPFQMMQKSKRVETFAKSQSEIIGQSVEIETTPMVGRRRKHPQKPGRHICSYCGRGCAKPSVLEKHLRAHTGERPFPCLDCGFSFKTKSNLYKHCKSRAHALKVNQGSISEQTTMVDPNLVEEIVETESNEISEDGMATRIIEDEEETESASDHDDQNLDRSFEASSSPMAVQSIETTELTSMPTTSLPSYKKKMEVEKLIEWSKNLEIQEKKKSHAMLEVHSHYPIKIAPKHGISMESLTVPDSEARPRLYSQTSTPEYSVSEPPLGQIPSVDSSIVTTPTRLHKAGKLSLPVIMSTETKGPGPGTPQILSSPQVLTSPPILHSPPILNTKEPSITISTETVKLPHPSLGREASKKGLKDLEELMAKLNSPNFQGIQISTSFNKLPDKSLEVIVHVASSSEGQVTGKTELKQKIDALVSATSTALATRPTPPVTSTPSLSSTPSFNRSDSKNFSSEHIKEHIQQLISANAAIVDKPMSDAPRPRAKNIFRQISDNAAFSQKVDTSNIVSTPLSPMLSLPGDLPRKPLVGKPLLSALSLPNSSEIIKKENLARKTDQLKMLNELTGSQTLSLTSDLPRSQMDRSASFNIQGSEITRGGMDRSASFNVSTSSCVINRIGSLNLPPKDTHVSFDSSTSLQLPRSSSEIHRGSIERSSSLNVLSTQHTLSKSITFEEASPANNNEFKIQIKLSKTQGESGSAVPVALNSSSSKIATSLLSMPQDISGSPQVRETVAPTFTVFPATQSTSQKKVPKISVSAPPSDVYPVNIVRNISSIYPGYNCPHCGDGFNHLDTLELHQLLYCTADTQTRTTQDFEQKQKVLIANYFQKAGSGLKRSVSMPAGPSGKQEKSQTDARFEPLAKHLERVPSTSLKPSPRPSELPLASYGYPKLALPDSMKIQSGSYVVDQKPTDLTNIDRKVFSGPMQILQASTPVLQVQPNSPMIQSPRILTPTSIPVMLNMNQQRQLFIPQSPLISESGAQMSPAILRSRSLAFPQFNLAATARSASMGSGAKTPSTPTPSFQAILPNTSLPLIGQPMISPMSPAISISEPHSQSQAVSSMKMRLKGKLLLKRSMSAEKMRESSLDSPGIGNRTPDTPGSANRPLFSDGSKLAQLLTKDAQQGPQSKRPKLGELKQMNSGQLKAVDYTEDDTPVSGSKLMKSRSTAHLGSSLSKQGSVMPISLSQSFDEARLGTMTAAILIKDGGPTDSDPVHFFSVPVVIAQPFYSQTKGLSSGYRSNISRLSGSQNVITLISPNISSKSFPGSKTVKELLIQKSQEAARSPSFSRSFSELSSSPASKPLQYDKGVNSNTTQQLREKLSSQDKLSERRQDSISPPAPKKPKTTAPLNLYGHLIATLRSTTHVSYCCVQRPQPFYVPISANKKISMYSNWKAAPYNPNPAGLTSKDLLTLYKSRYTSNPVYAEGGNSIPSSLGGFVTHSTYWTYHKQREGHDMKTGWSHSKEKDLNKREKVSSTTLEKVLTKIRETTPETSKKETDASKYLAALKKEKVCRGGFKTDAEYTYIRGRGRGNYVCETCGIRCRKPSMLKKHIRTHTDHRPYHCRHCKFSFKTKGNLTKHMKSKAHQKKCIELGIVPVPTSVEDCQIDDEELAAQMASYKDSGAWAEDSIEDDDGEDDKDDSMSLDGDDEMDKREYEFERSMVEVDSLSDVPPSSPVYVAVQVSESDEPALMKITQKGASSSLGTVYGFDGTSYADRAMPPDKSSDPARAQVMDTEIARSLLELSKKAESEERGESSVESGEKRETRLGNLIGALMSRTKPLSGLVPKDESLTVSQSLPIQPLISFHHDLTDPDSSSSSTKRPSDLYLGVEVLPSRKRFYVSASPSKTPKEKEVPTYPQTPLNASILSYLPPCLSTKVAATKDSNYRGPIVGQIIQQDSVVMTPIRSSASSSTSGLSFQFSHPFLENIIQSVSRSNSKDESSVDITGHSGALKVSISDREKTGQSKVPGVTEAANQIKIFLTDDSGIEVWNNQSSDNSSFECDCGQKCLDSHDLAVHKLTHVSDPSYKCNRCDIQFSSENAYVRHLQSPEHKDRVKSNAGKCVYCGVQFTEKDQLHVHLRSRAHFKELEGLGVISSGVYESLEADGELDGLDVEDTEQYFQYLISKSTELSQRLDNVTKGENSNQNNSVIQSSQSPSSSDNQFQKRLDYEKHDEASNERVTVEIKHEPIDMGEIGRGGFVSANQTEDDDVQIVEAPQGPISPKIVKVEDGLDGGPHLCGICRKGFKDLQELRAHIITHAELRPYVCEYCDAGFTNAQSLKTHLHTHMQERPYVCGRCGDTFTQADDLHLHMSTHSTLLHVKSMDQSSPSISQFNQSPLRPTVSFDHSKLHTEGNQSVLRSYSVDQQKTVFKPSDQSTSSTDNPSRPGSANEFNQSQSVIVLKDLPETNPHI